MSYYVPALTYTFEGDFNSVIGGVYSTEKKAVDALIQILVRNYKITDFDMESGNELVTCYYTELELERTEQKIMSIVSSLESLISYCKKYNDTYFEQWWNLTIKKFDLDQDTNFIENIV